MTKENELNGWRSPDEKPVDGVTLLVAMRNREGNEYVGMLRKGLRPMQRNSLFEVLAWQYCPMYAIGMERRNSERGWRNPNDYPAFNTRLLVALKDNKYNTAFITIIEAKEFDKTLNLRGFPMVAWQYLPVWEEELKGGRKDDKKDV